MITPQWIRAYRFKTHSIHSPWRITRRMEDLIRGSRNLNQLQHLPGLSSLPASITVLWKRACGPTRLQRITTSSPAASKVIWVQFGDYFKTWNWETGFRYSEDSRVERDGGIVDTNALRQALLDTNPATAFNPFGLNQNSRAVIDKSIRHDPSPRDDIVDARGLEVDRRSVQSSGRPHRLRDWR